MAERVDPLVSTPPAFTGAAARKILRDGFGLDGALTLLAGLGPTVNPSSGG